MTDTEAVARALKEGVNLRGFMEWEEAANIAITCLRSRGWIRAEEAAKVYRERGKNNLEWDWFEEAERAIYNLIRE